MERTDFLITKVRQNTNLTDRNGVAETEVLRHLNDAQRTIQSIIYQAELEPDLFVATVEVTPEEVTEELPSDVFAGNAILYVEPVGRMKKLTKIQSYERGNLTGYFIENNTIGFTTGLLSQYGSFKVKYFKRLPTLDIRRGKISARTATSITLAVGFSTAIETLSEFVTVVDRYGTVIQAGLPIDAFNTGTGVITTEGLDIALVTTDHYVVCGKLATSHCQLPEECESFLLDFTQKKMRSKNVSKETSNQSLFSEEQKELLVGLFQGNSADPMYPPILDNNWP